MLAVVVMTSGVSPSLAQFDASMVTNTVTVPGISCQPSGKYKDGFDAFRGKALNKSADSWLTVECPLPTEIGESNAQIEVQAEIRNRHSSLLPVCWLQGEYYGASTERALDISDRIEVRGAGREVLRWYPEHNGANVAMHLKCMLPPRESIGGASAVVRISVVEHSDGSGEEPDSDDLVVYDSYGKLVGDVQLRGVKDRGWQYVVARLDLAALANDNNPSLRDVDEGRHIGMLIERASIVSIVNSYTTYPFYEESDCSGQAYLPINNNPLQHKQAEAQLLGLGSPVIATVQSEVMEGDLVSQKFSFWQIADAPEEGVNLQYAMISGECRSQIRNEAAWPITRILEDTNTNFVAPYRVLPRRATEEQSVQ